MTEFSSHTSVLSALLRLSVSLSHTFLLLSPLISCIPELTANDVHSLSDRFWMVHADPTLAMDGGAATLLSIQYNLCAGTLSKFAAEQPYVANILQKVLAFEVS